MKGVFLDLASLDNDDLNLAPLRQALAAWDLYPHTDTVEVAARLQGGGGQQQGGVVEGNVDQGR